MKRELKKIFFIRKKDSVQTFRLAMLLCIVGGFLDAILLQQEERFWQMRRLEILFT